MERCKSLILKIIWNKFESQWEQAEILQSFGIFKARLQVNVVNLIDVKIENICNKNSMEGLHVYCYKLNSLNWLVLMRD